MNRKKEVKTKSNAVHRKVQMGKNDNRKINKWHYCMANTQTNQHAISFAVGTW